MSSGPEYQCPTTEGTGKIKLIDFLKILVPSILNVVLLYPVRKLVLSGQVYMVRLF